MIELLIQEVALVELVLRLMNMIRFAVERTANLVDLWVKTMVVLMMVKLVSRGSGAVQMKHQKLYH